MGDDPSDAELQREIRAGRAFSLEEAIGRLAGPGGLKGASPASGRREAEAAIGEFVRRNLPDLPGALAPILIRAATGSELLDRDPHRPFAALAAVIDRHLASDGLLQDLVREADQEWGQLVGERPYFEREGAPADPADPYTAASVRAALTRLRGGIRDDGG
jgi:hypothetical protein